MKCELLATLSIFEKPRYDEKDNIIIVVVMSMGIGRNLNTVARVPNHAIIIQRQKHKIRNGI